MKRFIDYNITDQEILKIFGSRKKYESDLEWYKEKPEQYIPDNQDNEQTKRNKSLFLSCLDTEEAFTWKAYLPFIQRCVLFEQNAVLYACFETNFQCTLTIAL